MYYIHLYMYKIKKIIDQIGDPVYSEFFDIESLILKKQPEYEYIIVPLKKGMKNVFENMMEMTLYIQEEFSKSDKYNKDLDLVEFIINQNLYVKGEDFIDVDPNYTYDFIRTNICNFALNWTNGRLEYSITPYGTDDDMKDVIATGCNDMVGSVNDRIADVFKLSEILLLHIAGKLTAEESQKIKELISNTNRDDLVVTNKYEDVSEFIDKFFNRQKTVRKIIDRKTKQYEERRKRNEN